MSIFDPNGINLGEYSGIKAISPPSVADPIASDPNLIAGFRSAEYNSGTGTWLSFAGTNIAATLTAGDAPTVSNGRVVFAGGSYFDGSANFKTAMGGLNDTTIVVVGQITTSASISTFIDMYASLPGRNMRIQRTSTSTRAAYVLDRTSSAQNTANGASNSFPTSTIIFMGNRSKRNDASGYFTMTGNTTTTTASVVDAATFTPATIRIGSNYLGSNTIIGDIACILIYNKALTSEEMTTLKGLLSDNSTYGLSGVTLS